MDDQVILDIALTPEESRYIEHVIGVRSVEQDEADGFDSAMAMDLYDFFSEINGNDVKCDMEDANE